MKLEKGTKTLVTGGAGFIGSHIVDELMKRECTVTVLDNLYSGRLENISHHMKGKGFDFIQGDICSVKDVSSAMKDCDVVFHEAAVVGVRHYVEDPLSVIRVNVFGTHNVLETARKLDVPRVIFASTSEVFGKNTSVPLTEESERILGSTRIDRWCYSTSKALDEHSCYAYARKHGLGVAILRYFNAYGPRQECSAYGGVIARFISQVLSGKAPTVFGDGTQTRAFTYVSDIVSGTIGAAECEKAFGEAYNLGSNKEITILELAKLVIRLAEVEGLEPVFVPYDEFYGTQYEDLKRRSADFSKAERDFGFAPRVRLEEGLALTLNWYKQRPERLRHV